MADIKPIVIAVDFDGTCVTHEYPSIGKDIGAVPVLKRLVDKGHQLILHTMRSGDTLAEAVQWFADNDIPLHCVGKNPTQHTWTDSLKCYANLYIDDAALGCPLTLGLNYKATPDLRAYVDWKEVELMLVDEGIL